MEETMRQIVNAFVIVFEFVMLSRIYAWVRYIIKKRSDPQIAKPNLKAAIDKEFGKKYLASILWGITIIGGILFLLLRFAPQNTIGSPIEAADYLADYYVLVSESRDSEGYMLPATIHVTSEEFEVETETGGYIETNRVYYLLEVRYPNGQVQKFEDYEVEISNERSYHISELDKYILLTDEKINNRK
jgi:hypothetical protein